MRNRALNRLRNSIAVASFGEPSPQPLPAPADVYRNAQLQPKMRHEDSAGEHGNVLQFITTTHFLDVNSGSIQVLAQNKIRQYLAIYVVTQDALIYANFSNECTVLAGFPIGVAYGAAFQIYSQKVPNNSLYICTPSSDQVQVCVVEGGPEK